MTEAWIRNVMSENILKRPIRFVQIYFYRTLGSKTILFSRFVCYLFLHFPQRSFNIRSSTRTPLQTNSCCWPYERYILKIRNISCQQIRRYAKCNLAQGAFSSYTMMRIMYTQHRDGGGWGGDCGWALFVYYTHVMYTNRTREDRIGDETIILLWRKYGTGRKRKYFCKRTM